MAPGSALLRPLLPVLSEVEFVLSEDALLFILFFSNIATKSSSSFSLCVNALLLPRFGHRTFLFLSQKLWTFDKRCEARTCVHYWSPAGGVGATVVCDTFGP